MFSSSHRQTDIACSPTATPRLFFGVGTGRCGTMAIANALSAEPGVTCTHEGKIRHREVPGERVLKYLTLENRLAYERPEEAQALFDRARGDLYSVIAGRPETHFGDIAYNYAPFLAPLALRYPEAKLIVFIRNGIDFVRSATLAEGEDPTPVGWPPSGKSLTNVERYIELGRLSPRSDDPLYARWGSFEHVARNAWLWAETNRLILTAVAQRPPELTFTVRFETFFSDPTHSYRKLREFLEIPGAPAAAALDSLCKPINHRTCKVVGAFESWTPEQRSTFVALAGPMMRQLGYELPS